MRWPNRYAVHQKTLPILCLVYGIEDLHPVLGKDVAFLLPQPCGGKGVDHSYDALVVGDETMAEGEATCILLHAARYQASEHLPGRHLFQQKFVHAVTG